MKATARLALEDRRANARDLRAAISDDKSFDKYLTQLAPKRGEEE